jgi:hypothetical protein
LDRTPLKILSASESLELTIIICKV